MGKNKLINEFNPILTNIMVPNVNPITPKNRKIINNIENIKFMVNQANIVVATQNCPTNYNPPVLNKYNTNNSSQIIHHNNTISYKNKLIKGNGSLNTNTAITADNYNITPPPSPQIITQYIHRKE